MGYGVAVLWLDVEMSNKALSKLEPQESSRMATTRPYYYTDHAGAKQGSAHPPHSMPTRRTSTGIFILHQQKAFVPLTILIKKAVKLKEKDSPTPSCGLILACLILGWYQEDFTHTTVVDFSIQLRTGTVI